MAPLNERLIYLQNNLEILINILQFLSLSSDVSTRPELSFVISHAINWVDTKKWGGSM